MNSSFKGNAQTASHTFPGMAQAGTRGERQAGECQTTSLSLDIGMDMIGTISNPSYASHRVCMTQPHPNMTLPAPCLENGEKHVYLCNHTTHSKCFSSTLFGQSTFASMGSTMKSSIYNTKGETLSIYQSSKIKVQGSNDELVCMSVLIVFAFSDGIQLRGIY